MYCCWNCVHISIIMSQNLSLISSKTLSVRTIGSTFAYLSDFFFFLGSNVIAFACFYNLNKVICSLPLPPSYSNPSLFVVCLEVDSSPSNCGLLYGVLLFNNHINNFLPSFPVLFLLGLLPTQPLPFFMLSSCGSLFFSIVVAHVEYFPWSCLFLRWDVMAIATHLAIFPWLPIHLHQFLAMALCTIVS